MSNYAQQVEDRIWELLEGRTQLAALVLAGNRAKETAAGWLRERIARAPNDFPQIAVKVGRFSNSGFETPAFFGMESGSYPGAAAGQYQRRRYDFQIVITNRDLVSTTISAVEHEVQAALSSDGRSNWGLSFVLRWAPPEAPITAQRREVNFNNQRRWQTTITVPVEMEFLGATAILAASS